MNGSLRLAVLSEEPDFVQVGCAGDICLPEFEPEREPLSLLLGPQIYSRKVLLNLEKANCLDTSGISWLLHCDEAFRKAEGTFVLHSIPARVRYVLHLLRMEELLPTVTDLAAAKAFASRKTS